MENKTKGLIPFFFYAIIYKTKLYYGEGKTKSNHSRFRKLVLESLKSEVYADATSY